MKKIIFITLITGILLVITPLILDRLGFFNVNNPIQTRNLLIEGWINVNALSESPVDFNAYDTIFIVGLQKEKNFDFLSSKRQYCLPKEPETKIWVAGKSYLFLNNLSKSQLSDTVRQIKVIAKSSAAKGITAHFYLLIKDSVIAQTYTKTELDTFTFDVAVPKNKLEDLSLYFSNDILTETEDINLDIYDIILDNTHFSAENMGLIKIPITFNNNDLSAFASGAREIEAYIKTNQLTHARLICVDTIFHERNKTLFTARFFSRYLKNKHIQLNNLNIYTLDYHSRRTKLAYWKALPSSTKFGMISAKCNTCYGQTEFNKAYSMWLTYDEFFSWIYMLFS